MDLKKLNHIAIKTTNLDKTLAFYCGILGFKQLETTTTDTFISTFLSKPEACTFEVIQTLGEGAIAEPVENGMVDHIAFDVDGVQSTEKELIKLGVTIDEVCTELKEFNTRVLKIRDPNGICIALREDINK